MFARPHLTGCRSIVDDDTPGSNPKVTQASSASNSYTPCRLATLVQRRLYLLIGLQTRGQVTVRTIHSPAMHGSVAGTRPGLCTQHARPVTHAPGMGVRRQRAARTYVFARMQPAFASRPSLRPSSAALRARPAVCNAWFNQGKGTDERLAEIAVAQQDGEQLESLQLPREVRDRVSDAVEDLGGQVHGL